MKKFFTYFSIMLTLLSMVGCKSWLDINTNPNYVPEAKIKSLLPSAQLYTAVKVGCDINLYGYFWAQYVNQCSTTNQYYTHMTYDVTNSAFNSPWSYIYGSIMPTLKEIIEKGEAEEGNTNYVMEAKTMLAYELYLLTSLYDKVAYTEGYLTETTNPHFDSGEDTHKNIMSILEEVRGLAAKAKTDEANNPSSAADMIFGGDIDGWLQFANTLYIKVLMRDFIANKTKIESMLSEDNFLKADAAFDNFLDAADKSNPLYESDRRKLNTNNNIRACGDIANVLDASDPRFAYYYDNNPDGKFAGDAYGTGSDPTKSSRLAIGATDPVNFGTVDEAEFLKAEAYARLGNAAKAKEAYEAAITAAFARAKCKGANSFITGAYAFKSGSTEEMVEQIINQKWASNVRSMPIESWFDLNRTGYPVRGKTITDFHGVLSSGYPQRFLYSKTSADYNVNSPEQVDLNVKMWWQK